MDYAPMAFVKTLLRVEKWTSDCISNLSFFPEWVWVNVSYLVVKVKLFTTSYIAHAQKLHKMSIFVPSWHLKRCYKDNKNFKHLSILIINHHLGSKYQTWKDNNTCRCVHPTKRSGTSAEKVWLLWELPIWEIKETLLVKCFCFSKTGIKWQLQIDVEK